MYSQNTESQDLAVFKTILKYCILILALPVCAFFGSKAIVFDGVLGLTNINSNVYSAVVAVIVLHFALGCYIYRAYSYEEPAKAPAKVD